MSLHSSYLGASRTLCLVLCLGLCLHLPAAGQSTDFKVHPDYTLTSYQLGKEQGLRANLPHGFIQDQKGYIWLIANEWVQRYNGKRFETFFKMPDYRNGYAELIEDHRGRIWVFRYYWEALSQGNPLSGLDMWMIDPETGAAIGSDAIWEKESFDFAISRISAISYTGTGSKRRILLGTADGRVVSVGPSVKTITNSTKATPVSLLAGNLKGDIAYVREKSLTLVDSIGHKIVSRDWEHPISYLSIDADRGAFLTILKEKEIIRQGFFAEYQQGDWQIKSYSELGKNLDEHEIWLLQNDSFLVSHTKIHLKDENYSLFECLKCPKMFLDGQNNIWATNSSGITVVHIQPKMFKTLLNGNKIETRGILPVSDTSLLVHSYRGTYLVDLQDRILDHNSDMHAMIGINMDQQGRIWETAHGWYIGLIPDYNNQLALNKIWDSTLIKETNFGLFPLPDENGLWLATQNGLCHCSWDNAKVLATCSKVAHPKLEKLIVNYLEYADTNLWAVTSAGLFLIDRDRREVITYFDQLKDLNINHFIRQDSIFWFSTYYSGLIRWKLGDPDYQQITLSTEEDLFGIPSLCAVYDDGLGYLWMPSISGLYRLRKSDLAYQRFDNSYHIAHEEFNYFSHARLPGNRFAFGGLDGITVVDPQLLDQLDRNQAQIPLVISNVTVDNGKITEKVRLNTEQPIELRGQRDILKLNCYLLDYRSSLPGQIMYKLEGLDQEWQLLEGETLSLERLPFGKFTLKIRAFGTDKISRTEEWNIPIIAREPWYRNGLAQASLLLLVFGIGSAIAALRYQSVQKAKARLEVIVRERTAELETSRNKILQQHEELLSLNNYKSKIMAIMGHDLRGPILGLSNLGEKMKYLLDRGDTDRVFTICKESERQIDHLRMLIDNLLVWSLLQDNNYLKSTNSKVSLWELAESQIRLLETNAGNKDLSVQLVGDSEVDYEADPFVLGVLIRNLIANSIRYSPEGGSVRVQISSTVEEKPTIIIEDEGPGMSDDLLRALNSGRPLASPYQPDSQEGLGLGLWICSSLLPKIHGRWSFAPGETGKGLTVSLELLGPK